MILIISFAAAVIWIRVLKNLDKDRKLKTDKSFIRLFIFAGFSSLPLVFIISDLIEPILRPFYTYSVILYNILMVGMVEEVSKFIPFFLLTIRKQAVKEPRDGVIHAASVGLAFALVENIEYAFFYGLNILLIRSILTIVGHMTLASIWGATAGVYIYNRNTRMGDNHSPLMIAGSIIVAGTFHGIYNSLLSYDHFMAALFVDFIVLMISLRVLNFFNKTSPYKKKPIRDYKTEIPRLVHALDKNPENFYLNKQLGFCYLRAGNTEKGKRYLKKANKINSREISVRFFLNFIDYYQTGDFRSERALNYISESLPSRSKLILKRKVIEVFKNRPEKERALKILGF